MPGGKQQPIRKDSPTAQGIESVSLISWMSGWLDGEFEVSAWLGAPHPDSGLNTSPDVSIKVYFRRDYHLNQQILREADCPA